MTVSDLSATNLATLITGVIFSSEIMLRLHLKAKFSKLAELLRKIFGTLRSSNISDHWKEKVILRYAAKLLGFALIMPVHLGVAFIPLGLALWLSTSSFKQMVDLGLDITALLCITIVSLLYISLRMKRYV